MLFVDVYACVSVLCVGGKCFIQHKNWHSITAATVAATTTKRNTLSLGQCEQTSCGLCYQITIFVLWLTPLFKRCFGSRLFGEICESQRTNKTLFTIVFCHGNRFWLDVLWIWLCVWVSEIRLWWALSHQMKHVDSVVHLDGVGMQISHANEHWILCLLKVFSSSILSRSTNIINITH